MNRTFLVELLESRQLLSGGLDSTFGTNGVVSGAVNYLPGGQAQSMVLQPDGRIVIAANEGPKFSDPAQSTGTAVLRLLRNGALDEGFGNDGVVNILPSRIEMLSGLALERDGKIVIVGVEGGQVVTARFNADGTPDSSFGDGGYVETAFDGRISNPFSPGIAADANGRILVACETDDNEIAVARYTADGQLDASFGDSGTAIPPSSSGYGSGPVGIKLVNDGKILINGGNGLMGLMPNGQLDRGFGHGGLAFIPKLDNPIDANPVVQSDGKIVFGGSTALRETGRETFAAVRMSADGSLDSSFGQNSLAKAFIRDRGETHVSDSEEQALAVDQRGGIILAGITDDLSVTRFDFALSRLSPNGLIDRSFGSHGYVSTGGGNLWPGVDNEIQVIAIQPNGDIVVAGSSNDLYSWNMTGALVVARYTPDGRLDTRFGYEGRAGFYPNVPGRNVAAVQDDGKIVMASGYDVARLQPDGSLDPSFGDKGMILRKVDPVDDLLRKINARQALFVQPVAGGATLVGYEVSGFSEDEYSIVRYTDAGQVDRGLSIPNSTFKRIAKIAPGFAPTSIAVQNDGRVLLAGFDSSARLILVRFTARGALDISFGNKGIVAEDFTDSFPEIGLPFLDAFYVDSAGRPTAVMTAFAFDATDQTGLVIASRFSEDGTLDSSFGAAPMVIDDSDDVLDVMPADDGSIGLLVSHLEASVSAVRLVDGNPDGSFGSGGKLALPVPTFVFVTAARFVSDAILIGGTASTTGKLDTVAKYGTDGSLDTGFGVDGLISLPQAMYAYGFLVAPGASRAVLVDSVSTTIEAITF